MTPNTSTAATPDTSPARVWVIGSDGSDGAETALRWGLSLAIGRAASIRVVRAWQLPPTAGAEFGVVPSIDLEPREAHLGLDDLAASAIRSGVQVTSEVLYGGAARLLLEASESADLLVVGSRGHGGFRRLLLGSVSQQCATHARRPVVVVRPRPDDDDHGDRDVDHDGDRDGDHDGAEPVVARLVVGVDGSPASQSALKWAHEFAGATLPVAAVGAWAISGFGAEEMQSELELLFQSAQRDFHQTIDQVEAELGAVGAFERLFKSGAPARRLIEACGPTDMLVVGERGHRGLTGGLLGSVTTEVLHRAAGPVAVIPATPDS